MTGRLALPSRMLLATRNDGKRRELAALLAPLGIAVVTLGEAGVERLQEEDAVERFDTFEENAIAKARYFFARSAMPTLADDSGLVVDALGGRPGVRSKRWSGRDDLDGRGLDEANNAALIRALRGAPSRAARFVCVAAYVDGKRELTRRGEIEGRILEKPAGTGGFGYDPYFFSTELARTLAEASMAEKGAVSHRARALRGLCDALVAQARETAGH